MRASALLFLPLVACGSSEPAPRAPAQPRAEPAAVGPIRSGTAELDLARLSAPAREAWALLRSTERFTDDALYDGGETPKEVIAVRILLREPAADAAFSALWEGGTLGARLYALCGLYYVDPEAFERGLAQLRGTSARIRYQSGCSILEDHPVADLVELRRDDVVRLDSRERTIRDWKALDQRRYSFVYDIAGGGFPDLFRTGGGYGEPPEQRLDEGVD